MNEFITIEEALRAIQQGEMIVLVDDEHRENEGDLIIAADKVTPEAINFMAKQARGQICLALCDEIVTRLQIPLMPERNKLPNQARFTASIEAVTGVTTGVSAYDRAHTIKVAVHPDATPNDISLPGHIFPLLARKGGILERAGHTEGSVDLAKLAGLQGAAVICEILKEDGTMARLQDLKQFAKQHQIKLVAVNDLIIYRLQRECNLKEIANTALPLKVSADFQLKIFKDNYTQLEHAVLIHGEMDLNKPILVRIHSECMTGDVFGSLRCDCGEQLEEAQTRIAKENGIILYMRQEGRSICLGNKIKSHQLQDQGLDIVEANNPLEFLADHRNHAACAQILRFLGINQIRLLTNSPSKLKEIEQFNIHITERVPLEVTSSGQNKHYLKKSVIN